MATKLAFRSPVLSGLLYGLIGGIAFLAVLRITTIILLQFLPFPFIVIASTLAIALAEKSAITFKRLFITGFVAFMTMTIVVYICFFYFSITTDTGPYITALGHLWRISAMTGIGIVSALLTSLIIKAVVKQKTH